MGWFGNYLLAREEAEIEDKKNGIRKIPFIKIGIMVFISVTLANITSTEINKLIAAHQLKEAAKKIEKEARVKASALQKRIAKQNEINEKQRIANKEIIDAQRKANKIEIERQRNAQKIRIETCKFWTEQYSKTRKQSDKTHRDNACKNI